MRDPLRPRRRVVIPREAGGALIASPTRIGDAYGHALVSVADDGRTIARWAPDPEEAATLAWPALVEHRGRTFMVYVALLGENRGQVRLRELGCVDP